MGFNFYEIVFDTTKDVVLKLNHPYCDECEEDETMYEEMAEHFAYHHV